MAWFECDASKITRLRKFRDLRVDLKWSVNETLGFLSAFRGAIVELNETGEISDWDPAYLCELTNVEADGAVAQMLWDSLVKNQWVVKEDERYLAVDYIDWAGAYLVRKYHNSDRQKLVNIWATHGRIYGRGGGDGGGKIGERGDNSGEKSQGSKEEVVRISELTGEEKLLKRSEILDSGEKGFPIPFPPLPKRETTTKAYPPTPQNGSAPPKERLGTKIENRLSAKRPEVKQLIDRFHEMLKFRFGEVPAGVHYGQLGREFYLLLDHYDVEEIVGRLKNWFASTDPFIKSNGFSPSLFFKKFNLLRDGPLAHSNPVGSNAKRYIDGLSTAGAEKEFPGG